MKATKMIVNILTKQIRFCNVFAKMPMAEPDPILHITADFIKDPAPKKVNLGVGAYRDNNLKPYVFNVVKKAEKDLFVDMTLNMEYTPMGGIPGFVTGAQKLIFGHDSPLLRDGKVASIQTIAGSGALSMGFQFVKEDIPSPVLVSDPTWANHEFIIDHSGLGYRYYPYYDPIHKTVKIQEFRKFFQNAEEGNIVLLQACAHNPTGVDPTLSDWDSIFEVLERKKLIPFFDVAYQGFASGDLVQDIQPVRHFARHGFPMIVSQSFSKIMGLYGLRTGALHVVTPDANTTQRVMSQLIRIVRGQHYCPPFTGARIAQKILNTQQLYDQWVVQLRGLAERIIKMRQLLKNKLQEIGTPGNWDHITRQIGMFSFTGLTEKQCLYLLSKYHIHMCTNGRMAMVGLTSSNVDYVATAMKDAVLNAQ